jgi:hypothetical protein
MGFSQWIAARPYRRFRASAPQSTALWAGTDATTEQHGGASMTAYRLLASALFVAWTTVSALQPKTMVGDPPKGLSAYDRGRLEANGVKGTLFLNCDDSCSVAVNGKEVGKSEGMRAAKAMVKLHPGDVICVLVRNTGGGDGFAMVFRATDGRASFAASCEGWYEYAPSGLKAWADVASLDASVLTSCRIGSNSKWKGSVEAASGLVCPMCIWGGSGQTTTYLLHVVTYADLWSATPSAPHRAADK